MDLRLADDANQEFRALMELMKDSGPQGDEEEKKSDEGDDI